MERMQDPTRVDEDLDRSVRRLCELGDIDRATTLVIRELGPSVLRFIDAKTRDETTTSDAFARFAEDVWRGLPGFAGRSPLRVWAFVIARNAALQALRKQNRDLRRQRPLDSSLAAKLSNEARSTTQGYLKSEVARRFTELRATLSPEEQELLVLRINERLTWEQIAKIQLEDSTPAEVKREAARLRKRFQLVRERLRRLAHEQGLVDSR